MVTSFINTLTNELRRKPNLFVVATAFSTFINKFSLLPQEVITKYTLAIDPVQLEDVNQNFQEKIKLLQGKINKVYKSTSFTDQWSPYKMDKYGNIGVAININGRGTKKLIDITNLYNTMFEDNYSIEVLKYEYDPNGKFSKLGQLRLLYMMLPLNATYLSNPYMYYPTDRNPVGDSVMGFSVKLTNNQTMYDKVTSIFSLLKPPEVTDTSIIIEEGCKKILNNVDELLSQIVTCSLDTRPNSSQIRGDAETEAKACFVVNANIGIPGNSRNNLLDALGQRILFEDNGNWKSNLYNDSSKDNHCYVMCISHGGSYNRSGWVQSLPFQNLISRLLTNTNLNSNPKLWKKIDKKKYDFQKLVIAYFRNEWEHVWDYLDMSERFGDPKYIQETIKFLKAISFSDNPHINECISLLQSLDMYYNIYIRPLIMAQCCGFVNQRKSDKRITKKNNNEFESTTGNLNCELDYVAYSKLFNNSIDMGHYGYSLSKILAKIINQDKELIANMGFLKDFYKLCKDNNHRNTKFKSSVAYMEIRLSLLKQYMKAETMIQWIEKLGLSNSFFNDIKKSPLEFNTFVRLLFVSRWSVMVCRKQNFKDYFKKYGFFFLRLLIRKILTGTYDSTEKDFKITEALMAWSTKAKVGTPAFDRSLGALKPRRKKKSTKKRKPKRKRHKRRPCKTVRECKKKLTSVKKRIKNLTKKRKKGSREKNK